MKTNLIQRLKESLDDTCFLNTFVGKADLKEAITALEAMPVWVKCSERMPPPETSSVLVFYDKDLVMEAIFFSGDATFREYDSRYGEYWKIEGVSHWMPLPAPPTTQSDGG
jgi:hypothetical protein